MIVAEGALQPEPRSAESSRSAALRRVAPAVLAITSLIVLYTQLERIAAVFTYGLAGLSRGSNVAAAVEFFLFEVPKVLLLLTAVVFVVGVVRSYFSPERARLLLA